MADKRDLTNELLIAASAASAKDSSPAGEQLTQRRDGDTLEVTSQSRRIKTLDDLLEHIEADMSQYEVAATEASTWDAAIAGDDGQPIIVPLYRVWAKLRPKSGVGFKDCVEAMIAGAKLPRKKTKPNKRAPAAGSWQVIVVADCHFGKYAWGKSTGDGDYDLSIADRLVRDAADELLGVCRPVRRTILFLGDLFHVDTVTGTTTKGTKLDQDGRIQKILQVGCDCLLRIVEKSAATCPTDCTVVNGNHDETLTWAFQRILLERFRNDERVDVSRRVTSRQYLSHGANLLGAAHGDKAKKRLPQMMALEAPDLWAKCWYREWHTGHYHSQAAEWQRPIETLDGVVVRVAPAICPPDSWHADSGFIGSRQAMESFVYRQEGGLTSMHVAGPCK